MPNHNTTATASGSISKSSSTGYQKLPYTPMPIPDEPVKPTYQAPDYTSLKPNTGIVDLVKKYAPDYADEENRAKMNQKNALIGDIAGLFAQGVGLSQGRRIFSPQRYATTAANENYNRVLNAKDAANRDYQGQLLNAQVADMNQDKEDKRNILNNAAKLYGIDVGNYKDMMKLINDRMIKNADLSMKGYQTKQAQMNADRSYNLESRKAADASARGWASIYRRGSGSGATASNAGSGATKNYKSILLNEGGNGTSEWYYPKTASGSVAGLYEQMRRTNPQEIKDIEDQMVNLGMDEVHKREAIVSQLLQKHPELTSTFTRIGGVRRASDFYAPRTQQPNTPRPQQKKQIKGF